MAVARHAAAVLLSALAGCASIAPEPPPERAPITGRFSAIYQIPRVLDGAQAAQGSFSLHERELLTALDLVSPFGQTLARIRVDNGSGLATLEASDGSVYEATSVETLTEQLLGWRVPVRQLAAWVQGRAAGELRRADDAGRMLVAADARWVAAIQEWGESRPRRMTLRWPEPGTESEADAGARVRIRLVIDP